MDLLTRKSRFDTFLSTGAIICIYRYIQFFKGIGGMLRISHIFTICLVLNLTFSQSLAEERKIEKNQEKDRLVCLYDRISNYLTEPADPIIVLLVGICDEVESTSITDSEKSQLPHLDIPINSQAPTLTHTDVLVVTRKQLKCFKDRYNEIIKRDNLTINAVFSEFCLK